MSEKKFKKSVLIEGNYNFNYLTNLLFLSKECLVDIFIKKNIGSKNNKKLFKNVRNLIEFLESSINFFNKISELENEIKCVIHNVEYKNDDENVVDDFINNNDKGGEI